MSKILNTFLELQTISECKKHFHRYFRVSDATEGLFYLKCLFVEITEEGKAPALFVSDIDDLLVTSKELMLNRQPDSDFAPFQEDYYSLRVFKIVSTKDMELTFRDKLARNKDASLTKYLKAMLKLTE